MDVTWNYKRNVLYIADSYNHKIKYVTGLSDNKQSSYYNTGNMASGGSSGPSSGMVHTLPLPVKVCEL